MIGQIVKLKNKIDQTCYSCIREKLDIYLFYQTRRSLGIPLCKKNKKIWNEIHFQIRSHVWARPTIAALPYEIKNQINELYGGKIIKKS